MQVFPRKIVSALGAGALTAGLMVFGTVTASASTNFTCGGGTVPAGTYRDLTIAGICSIDGGNVTVKQNVVIRSGAGLVGMFSGSSLSVAHNVIVGSNGLLFLGCDPVESPCLNDATATQGDSISGSLTSWRATAVVVHDSTIGGSVAVNGGGAGFGCASLFPNGPPDFTNFSLDTIGGNLTVKHLRTCWDGMNENTVGGSVVWNDNQGSPLTGDANLVDGNSIGLNLSCFSNNPTPHLSDFAPILNTVGGSAAGQCKALAA
jgi:hypothetical protein